MKLISKVRDKVLRIHITYIFSGWHYTTGSSDDQLSSESGKYCWFFPLESFRTWRSEYLHSMWLWRITSGASVA